LSGLMESWRASCPSRIG